MTQPSHAIAIIGGGFSGTALAITLLEAGSSGLLIHVVEPRPKLGWGIAYGDADAVHILNVPAERMTLWADRPRDFLDWARGHGPRLGWPEAAAAGPETYLPRRLYGHYIEARLDEAIRRAASRGGPVMVRHATRATNLTPGRDGFAVDLEPAQVLHADQVVLATGFPTPAQPFAVEGESPRYVANPWAPGALEQIGRDDSVLIIGTGLTMVDVVYSLDKAGHRGAVVALSRHGLLPRVHGYADDIPPLLDEDDARRGVVYALHKFRRALADGRADWRAAMDGLRPVIDSLWRALPATEQDRFLRHLKPYWEVHRHRMPAQSADLLLARIARSQLEIEPGRITTLTLARDGVEAAIRRRGAPSAQRRHFHWVVNCTPPAAPATSAGSLAAELHRRGLVRPDRTGMGLDVEFDGTVRDGTGRPIPGFYALGPLRRGHAMETTAVPHIRPQLEALTALLLGRAASPRRAANA